MKTKIKNNNFMTKIKLIIWKSKWQFDFFFLRKRTKVVPKDKNYINIATYFTIYTIRSLFIYISSFAQENSSTNSFSDFSISQFTLEFVSNSLFCWKTKNLSSCFSFLCFTTFCAVSFVFVAVPQEKKNQKNLEKGNFKKI